MAESILAKLDEKTRAKMEQNFKSMSSINPETILYDHRPLLVVYKDGTTHRFMGTDTVSAGDDHLTGVSSRDVVISPETAVSVRLYKPPKLGPTEKVPLVVYFHGGAFCVETASSPVYQFYLNAVCSQAKVVVISVDYRLAPEYPVPIAYEDSWDAVKWVAAADDSWLKDHADYSRVFFGGDSAGANIAHNMAKRVGKQPPPLPNLHLNGIVLIHPYFWGEERIGSEEAKLKHVTSTGPSKLWKFVCPGSSGSDDPLINPEKDPSLGEVGCARVLVLVAEQDALRDRGFHYKEALAKCGWKGVVEVVETMGETHVFHLMNPTTTAAAELMARVVALVNGDRCKSV